jgi:nicotinamide phosphoribosyltransferase
MYIFPPHQIDFYKSGHPYQYPKDTELVFSNFTPRSSRLEGVDKVVFFGLQYFIKEYLIKQWRENFFDVPWVTVENQYVKRMDDALGIGAVGTEHIKELHKLDYLPVEIKALPEGSRVDLRVPMLVIYNTLPEFFWVTNYLETIMSSTLWGGCTSATMAYEYKQILDKAADTTVGNRDFVPFQGHDFSCRGMFGFEASCISGAAHLTSFVGTDTVPAIDFLERYYPDKHANMIGCSVPATEHSVMSLSSEDDEIGTIRRLITEVYPKGIVSIVCDTWDFWKVITEYLPILKDEIMARDGKVVIRPDSGDPVDIICGEQVQVMGGLHLVVTGNKKALTKAYEDARGDMPDHIHDGAVECLWNTFGGTTTDKGFKQLDEHIGLIYGDSITLERCTDICDRLKEKEFASTNVVFGIGSYTYQYTTRDTFGFAVKATYAEVAGQPRNIFKKPKTDDGTKNSARGLTAVHQKQDGSFYMRDETTWDDVNNCALQTVFKDGAITKQYSLEEVRDCIRRG